MTNSKIIVSFLVVGVALLSYHHAKAYTDEDNFAFINKIISFLNNEKECQIPTYQEVDELQTVFTELEATHGPDKLMGMLSEDQKLIKDTLLDQWPSFQKRMTSAVVIRSAKLRSFLCKVEYYQRTKTGHSICTDVKAPKNLSDRVFEKNPIVRYVKHLETHDVPEPEPVTTPAPVTDFIIRTPVVVVRVIHDDTNGARYNPTTSTPAPNYLNDASDDRTTENSVNDSSQQDASSKKEDSDSSLDEDTTEGDKTIDDQLAEDPLVDIHYPLTPQVPDEDMIEATTTTTPPSTTPESDYEKNPIVRYVKHLESNDVQDPEMEAPSTTTTPATTTTTEAEPDTTTVLATTTTEEPTTTTAATTTTETPTTTEAPTTTTEEEPTTRGTEEEETSTVVLKPEPIFDENGAEYVDDYIDHAKLARLVVVSKFDADNVIDSSELTWPDESKQKKKPTIKKPFSNDDDEDTELLDESKLRPDFDRINRDWLEFLKNPEFVASQMPKSGYRKRRKEFFENWAKERQMDAAENAFGWNWLEKPASFPKSNQWVNLLDGKFPKMVTFRRPSSDRKSCTLFVHDHKKEQKRKRKLLG